MHDNAFAPVAAISLVLLLLPLPFHLRAGNAGVLLLFFWLSLGTLIYFINAIVWWDDVIIRTPIWCDISSKLITAVVMGGPCASICVLRRLESIASTRNAHTTDSDRRRTLVLELLVGLGVPTLYSALSIVNQGHRFDIIESVGCVPTFYYTPLDLILVALPPVLVGIISMIYSCLTLRWFIIRRRQFNAVLQSSCSGLDRGRYLRLMGLASTEVLWSLPVNLAAFGINLKLHGVATYTSWDDVHSGFGYIGQFPSEVWDSTSSTVVGWRIIEMGRWSMPVSCFLVFIFFGTSQEVRVGYMSWLAQVMQSLGLSKKKSSVPSTNTQSLPYVGQSPWEDEEKSIALTPRTPTSPHEFKMDGSDGFGGSSPDRAVTEGVSITVDRFVSK